MRGGGCDGEGFEIVGTLGRGAWSGSERSVCSKCPSFVALTSLRFVDAGGGFLEFSSFGCDGFFKKFFVAAFLVAGAEPEGWRRGEEEQEEPVGKTDVENGGMVNVVLECAERGQWEDVTEF